MRSISYAGALAALVDGEDVLLMPEIARRPMNDPVRRFVAAMCVFSADVDAGTIPGPYTDERAAAYARLLLIPMRQLLWELGRRPEELAELFDVPVEEVAERLAALTFPWPDP